MDLLPLPTGMIVLLALSIASACLCHWRVCGFWRASFLSALLTPLLFFVASYLQAGIPEPLEPIAFVFFGGFSLLVAIGIGVLAILARRFAPVGT